MQKSTKDIQMMIACSQEIDGVPDVIPLLPLGDIQSQKGDFVVDQESYTEMCKWFDYRGIDIPLDYEHQTLGGGQAPAGGWIKELILTDDAICGRVEWTSKAAEYLKNKEYRYLSPVVMVRKNDRKAVRLPSVALTNTPAINHMVAIVNSEFYDDNDDDKGEEIMELLKKVAELLGLPEGASESDVLAALTTVIGDMKTLKENGKTGCAVVANKTILSLLDLKETAQTAEVSARIAALQNPANFVPVEQYNLISCKLAAQESGGLIETALRDGKITPAQKAWAEQYVLSDKAGFEKFLEIAQPVVPMAQVSGDDKKTTRPGAKLDTVICKALGISAEDAEKFGKDVE